MMTRQFRVLYRDFLFSVVDRELLSTHARGDASQLLLQLVTLLACLSVCFCLPVLSIGAASETAYGRLAFAWSIEHFLIATTMLIVGVFAVLSWDRMFPGQRDVLVLGPLPIRAHTILLARFCAVASALGLTVFTFHVATGAIWPLALNGTAQGGAIHAPRYTFDAAIPPVAAADLQAVLDDDLADAIRNGPLAPGGGGGASIGIYQRGVRRIFTYGAAAPDSIFQIGSATKPFTGLLLADMVERGLVEIDEPVRELIPAAGLPRPVGDEITLIDWSRIVPAYPEYRRASAGRRTPAIRSRTSTSPGCTPSCALVASRGARTRLTCTATWDLDYSATRSAGVQAWTMRRSFVKRSPDRWK